VETLKESTMKTNKGGNKKGGGSLKETSRNKSMLTGAPKDKWKFSLHNWVYLPDIFNFVGSSFIVSDISMNKTHDDKFDYDITIAKLPESNPDSQLYKSPMDIAKQNKRARAKLEKKNKKKRTK
jgi:hypothetical protein